LTGEILPILSVLGMHAFAGVRDAMPYAIEKIMTPNSSQRVEQLIGNIRYIGTHTLIIIDI